MRIKRADIIEALRTEPLATGDFISVSRYGHSIKSQDDIQCVCAVGAVIRRALGDKLLGYDHESANKLGRLLSDDYCTSLDAETDAEVMDEVQSLLKSKNYWGALSVFFEHYYQDEKTYQYTSIVKDDVGTKHYIIAPRNRRKLYNFVNKYFPKTMEIPDKYL